MAPQNPLPIHGNERTMNLNTMILTNIQASPYFKVNLYELKTYHEVIDEIYYKVDHLEPWEKGSRKTSGQTGMCGGVRGVGAGGIVSSSFCLLYKLFTLRLTHKQLQGLITHTDSPYIRALGFMYIRYTQPPAKLWEWYEDYLEDDEEIDVKAGGGHIITIGELLRQWLVKLEWYSTLFPRIPVPIQKDLEKKMAEFEATHMPKPEPPPQPVEPEVEEPSFGEAERIAHLKKSQSPGAGGDRHSEHRERDRYDRERPPDHHRDRPHDGRDERSRDHQDRRSRDRHGDRSRDPRDESSTDARDDRHRHARDEHSRDARGRSRDHRDEHSRDHREERSRDHRDEHSRDHREERSRDYRDERARDSKYDRSRDAKDVRPREHKNDRRDDEKHRDKKDKHRDREVDRNHRDERSKHEHKEGRRSQEKERHHRDSHHDKDKKHRDRERKEGERKESHRSGSKERKSSPTKDHKRSRSQERHNHSRKKHKRADSKERIGGRESSFERDLRREKSRQQKERHRDDY